MFTQHTDKDVLLEFYKKVRPYGIGWNRFKRKINWSTTLPPITENLTRDIASMLLGCAAVYTTLFGFGYVLYGNVVGACVLLGIAFACGVFLFRNFKK